jgi:thioredoxin-related protein
MVVFSLPQCSHCKVFAAKTLSDPAVEAAVRHSFDAVHVNLFSDIEMVSPQGEAMSVKEFGRQERADFTPAIYFYDVEGRRVLRIIGYHPPERFVRVLRYVSDGHYRNGALREYLAATAARPASGTATAPVDDPIFERPPHNLDRRDGTATRQLMVVFDRPDCEECVNVFGTLLKEPTIRSRLEQLEVVRLSLDDRGPVVKVDGTRTTAAAWHAELGLHRTPAFAFFNVDGNPALLTDAFMTRGRLDNTLAYVLEEAYLEGINYQRFTSRRRMARSRANAN